MPAIQAANNGSGLDVPELVDKLVAAEGAPATARLDRKEAEVQEGLTAMGAFRGAVSGFQATLGGLADPDVFAQMRVDSDDEDALTATANAQASPGRYEVEIVQLAQAQRLASDTLESDVNPLGTGTLTLQIGRFDAETGRFRLNPDTRPHTITIDAASGSLRGIAEAINRANAGVRAAVVNDGSGYRLLLSSAVAGNDGQIRLQVDDDDGDATDRNGLSFLLHDPAADGGVDADGNPLPGATGHLQELVPAQDALLRIDGLEIRRSSNHINDAITGVELELQPGSEGRQVTLAVAADTGAVVDNIRQFVGAYNELMQLVNQLTGYDPETRTAGPLSGDAAVRGIAHQLRNLIGQDFSAINETYTSLASIGITTERDGTLTLDEGRLQAAIEDDLPEVSRLFAVSGEASDPLVEYRGAGEATQPGRYVLEITQMPAAASLSAGPATEVLELAEDATFRVAIDGVQSGLLTLTAASFPGLAALAGALQSALASDTALGNAGAAARVAVEGNRLVIRSDKVGGDSRVELVAMDPALAAITGFTAGSGSEGQDVAGRFDGIPAEGQGRRLIGTRAAEGLTVDVLGGGTGPRGVVYFSNGVAAQLDRVIKGYLDHDGLFTARMEGYDARLQDIQRQRERLARRLEQVEERYTKKFSALDATLSQMRGTSERLARDLQGLPGARSGK